MAPVEPAAFHAWHAPQPAVANTFTAAALGLSAAAAATFCALAMKAS